METFTKKDIEKQADIKALTDAIEKLLQSESLAGYNVPDRQQYQYGNATHLIMPVFGPKYCGLKNISIHPENEKSGLPVIQGTMHLTDTATGKPLAAFDGGAITGFRTGAVGALAIRHLAPQDASTLGIVGAGNIGYHLALAADTERSFQQIMLFDVNQEKREKTANELKAVSRCDNIVVAGSVEELTASSEVITTATSSSSPVLPEDKPVLFGKTIIAMGSYMPNMKELPIQLFENLKKCVIDTRAALSVSGDMIEPIINNRFHIDDITEMSALLQQNDPQELGETRLFKSAGSAIFDLAVAEYLYKRKIRNT